MAKTSKTRAKEAPDRASSAARSAAGGLGSAKARIETAAKGGMDVLARIRKEAQDAFTRNRSDLEKTVQKALTSLRKDVLSRADQALRGVEKRILRRLNAASAEQLRDLERRVARIEKMLKQAQAGRGTSAAA